MTKWILGMTAATVLLASAIAQADDIRVQGTTDTVDAGLIEGLVRPAYLAARPGDHLSYTAVGTGKALDNARAGLADVVITHAPSLEAQFVADGYSLEPLGRQIFYSDYVIVGPTTDPAHVLTNHPHDAVGAFQDIAAAGGAGPSTADFLSRGDRSGTNVQEQKIWHLSSVTKQTACNAGTDTTRDEPGPRVGSCASPAYPAWYHLTNLGQADNVLRADACPTATFASGSCYTMTDRGTFNRLVNSGSVSKLKVVSEKNSSGAPGGENLLINPFSAYIVNPGKFSDPNKPNVAAGTRFVDFLTSPAFQTAVDAFPSATDPAFRGDAFAKVTLTTPLPPTAAAGSSVAIHATLTNKLPGAPPIDGLPVQLQSSGDGTNYTNVGAPVPTDATGAVTVNPTIVATTHFRLSMPRYDPATAQSSALSPNTQDIGIVSVPGATPPPPPTTPPHGDTKAPSLIKVKLTLQKLSLTISEAGTVKVTIAKRIKHGKHVRYKTVRSFTIKATKAGKISKTWKHRLAAGNYRVKLRATDHSGNVRHRTVTSHIRK